MKKYFFLPALTAILSLSAIISPITATAGDHSKILAYASDVSEDATIKAVKLDAEWCSACKSVTKKLAKALTTNEFDKVSFLQIDYTDKKSENYWAQAAKFGVETELREYLNGEPKTGLLILFDAQTNTIIDVISNADDTETLAAKINKANT